MKKFLTTIMLLAITITMFSSCGAKNTKGTTGLSLSLSDNLPVWHMDGNYKVAKTNADIESTTEVLWAYEGDDNAEYRHAYAYKWPVTDKSLLDETIEDAQKYFPIQEPEVIICNNWMKAGDYEYAYYAAIVDDKYMGLSWVFEDAGYFYQIFVEYDLITHTVPGTNMQFAVPNWMKEVKPDNQLALMTFEDPNASIKMQEFPNVAIYLNDGDFEFTVENIEKKWKVENVKINEHEWTTNDKGTKIPGYIVDSEYTENGKTIICRENLIKTGDKYFGIEFYYDKTIDFPEYIENSYRAFLYTVVEK